MSRWKLREWVIVDYERARDPYHIRLLLSLAAGILVAYVIIQSVI